MRRWCLILSASTGESKVVEDARAACAGDTKIAEKDWVVNLYSCECDPRFQETDVDGDLMRPRTGCKLSVWKSSVCECGDRLVIKQLVHRIYRGKECCPDVTNTHSSIRLVGWLVKLLRDHHTKLV